MFVLPRRAFWRLQPIARSRTRNLNAVQSGIPEDSANATALLQAWGRGDQHALDQLMPLVQRELQRLARQQMGRERAGHTLQATALVNEVFVRLIDGKQVEWRNRAHFFAMAARLMRRILVDAARARKYQKRGANAPHVSLDEALVVSPARSREIVALDDALEALATIDPRKSHVVELRYFGGLSVEETAEALHVSPDTV